MRSESRFEALAGPVETVKEPSPMQLSRKRFLRRLIPWGVAMLREAEGLGLNVDRIPLEQLADEIFMAQIKTEAR